MNTVERIRKLCKEQRIPLSRLERDLGFANGYIGQLKKGTVPNDRLVKIADYLNVSEEYLNSGNETETIDSHAITLAKIAKDEELIGAVEVLLTLPKEKQKLVVSLIKELGKDH